MSVARLTDEMDSSELNQWLIFFEVSEERAEARRKEAQFERSITGE